MLDTVDAILAAWAKTTWAVASTPSDFAGRDKETQVLRRLRAELECAQPTWSLRGPDAQQRFDGSSIDLVCESPAGLAWPERASSRPSVTAQSQTTERLPSSTCSSWSSTS